jgi:hypothetical protein
MNASFWTPTPAGPIGVFDDNAKLNFSFDAADWLKSCISIGDSAPGTTLESVQVVNAHARLTFPLLTLSGTLVRLRIENTTATVRLAATMSFTLRLRLSDGQQDDRTFYLIHTRR